MVQASNARLQLNLAKGCYPQLVDGIEPAYGYWPGLAPGIVFCMLFGIAVIGHTVQFARFRRWSSVLCAVGAVTETIGWAGRTWSAKCPYNHDAFLMQITTLIIAPTFFAACLYVQLGILIRMLGPQSSRLSANSYTIIFCTCDVISLVVQAIGGGMASVASGKVGGNTTPGTLTMVAGIVFQLCTMTFFALLVVDFARRVHRMRLERNVMLTLVAMTIMFVMIYIRSIYRTIELAQGWRGYLITHEGFFIGLDAAIMFVAVLVFLVLDPAWLLPKSSGNTSDQVKSDGEQTAMESLHGANGHDQ